jgi:HTH-type transcriptional regulator/antitoxin HigA
MARSIETEQQYEAALARVDKIFDAESGTPEGDELVALVTAIELYEDETFFPGPTSTSTENET